jgi:hypothetical protein
LLIATDVQGIREELLVGPSCEAAAGGAGGDLSSFLYFASWALSALFPEGGAVSFPFATRTRDGRMIRSGCEVRAGAGGES